MKIRSSAKVKKILILFSKVYGASDGGLEVRWRDVKENSLLLIQGRSRVVHSTLVGLSMKVIVSAGAVNSH